ncbi:MAG: hypothetical protein KF845_04060 [Cyclobacteriaceae bacterium]|nr:hypothetical protein [Cyclobacteriaceae bacterium]
MIISYKPLPDFLNCQANDDFFFEISDYLLISGANDAAYSSVINTKIDFNTNEITFESKSDNPETDETPVKHKYLTGYKKGKFDRQ